MGSREQVVGWISERGLAVSSMVIGSEEERIECDGRSGKLVGGRTLERGNLIMNCTP